MTMFWLFAAVVLGLAALGLAIWSERQLANAKWHLEESLRILDESRRISFDVNCALDEWAKNKGSP